MQDQELKVGDVVRYAVPLEPGDEQLRFDVVEVNGDRCFIRLRCNLAIPPTYVIRTDEIARAASDLTPDTQA